MTELESGATVVTDERLAEIEQRAEFMNLFGVRPEIAAMLIELLNEVRRLKAVGYAENAEQQRVIEEIDRG